MAKKLSLPFSVYLAGDIGGYKTKDSLRKDLSFEKVGLLPDDHLVLLGDNIYPKGIPGKKDGIYPEVVGRLRRIVDHLLDHFKGPLWVLPGNHDYNRGQRGGADFWANQKEVFRSFFEGKVLFTTDGRPCMIELDACRLILIDTQFYLQPDLRNRKRHLVELRQSLQGQLASCQGYITVVCGHHPLYSRAMHGGKFSLKQHLFPLSLLRKKLMVPLPLVGSAVALGRRTLGAREDMRHPHYRLLRRTLKQCFDGYTNLIYVAGHDHNLQHYPIAGNQYLVSGSASKTAYVRPGGRSDFVAKVLGCFRIVLSSSPRLEAITFGGEILADWPLSPLTRKQD